MARSFKIYSLSNFQIFNTMLLTIVTMLQITSPWFIYFVAGSLFLWFPRPVLAISYPLPLQTTNLFFPEGKQCWQVCPPFLTLLEFSSCTCLIILHKNGFDPFKGICLKKFTKKAKKKIHKVTFFFFPFLIPHRYWWGYLWVQSHYFVGSVVQFLIPGLDGNAGSTFQPWHLIDPCVWGRSFLRLWFFLCKIWIREYNLTGPL